MQNSIFAPLLVSKGAITVMSSLGMMLVWKCSMLPDREDLKSKWPLLPFLKLLSVKDNSGQMHLSAADHVGQNSSANEVRSGQMHLAAVRLNWNGLQMVFAIHWTYPIESIVGDSMPHNRHLTILDRLPASSLPTLGPICKPNVINETGFLWDSWLILEPS